MRKTLYFLALLTATLTAAAGPFDQQKPLHPDKAFAISTRTIDGNTLEASWVIADGYYMYRKFFKFEALDKNIKLNPPVLPKGIIKDDKVLNEVLEVYKKKVVIRLSIDRLDPKAGSTRLRITSQGCNEPIGLCYNPVTKDISFKLLPVAGTQAGTPRSLKDLRKKISTDPLGLAQPLPVDRAFNVDVTGVGKRTVRIRFNITEGYYLYRKEIKFSLQAASGKTSPPGVRIAKFRLPPGITKVDSLGKNEVYTKNFSVILPIYGADAPDFDQILLVRYQGCKEKGICYTPVNKKFSLKAAATGPLLARAIEVPAGTGNGVATAAPTTIAGDKTEARSWNKFTLAILFAFAAGLALTFTPCVLPLIPILSSIIVGQGDKKISGKRGGLLAIVYVLGTAVVYTIAGYMAGATGDQLQSYFQNPWAISITVLIFTALALSMFGFYDIQMPAFIQSRLHKHNQGRQGGTLVAVFILGMISSLIVGACVSPVLISALGVAIASQDPLLGSGIMFSMSLGMGTILILIGFGAGFLLPKVGPWMDRIKHGFGVLLLAVAIYIFGFLPEVPVLYLWAALLIITSIYFGAIQPVPDGASGWRYFFKGVGLLMLIWGVLALIGAFTGSRDILRPIQLPVMGLTGTSVDGGPIKPVKSLFIKVRDVKDLNEQIALAKGAKKPVLVDYYASWCTDCRRMEATTFRDPQVQRAMARFVVFKVDVSEKNPVTQAMKARFGVYGPPATIFIDRTGKELKRLHFYGYRNAEEFVTILNQVK